MRFGLSTGRLIVLLTYHKTLCPEAVEQLPGGSLSICYWKLSRHFANRTDNLKALFRRLEKTGFIEGYTETEKGWCMVRLVDAVAFHTKFGGDNGEAN